MYIITEHEVWFDEVDDNGVEVIRVKTVEEALKYKDKYDDVNCHNTVLKVEHKHKI